MVSELNLHNVTVENRRVELLSADSRYRGSIDLFVARAVTSLKELADWSLPLARSSSNTLTLRSGERKHLPLIAAYKGGDLTKEIKAARATVGVTDISTYDLTFRGLGRTDLQDKSIVFVSLTTRRRR
jgi:16S rRNA G527 N7-methylase RsmG